MLQFFVLCVIYTLFQALDGVNAMDCSLGLSSQANICPDIMAELDYVLHVDKDLRKYCCIDATFKSYCCNGLQFIATLICIVIILMFTVCIIRYLWRRIRA